jgi:DMSO/TMAO reductase YedYZ molybdopterin-dependent catalytic subunit
LESAVLDALAGKRPLIKRSFRPPNYETPVDYFNEPFTPNDAFFVRYHVANIPEINASDWKLHISGDALQMPVKLTLTQLKQEFEAVEIAAVCQCAGNRRGLSDPHVPGVQWGYGAMGNARWKGARLKDVLNKAGIKKEALEVTFDGADNGVIEKTPDFVKSLPLWKALDGDTLLAYEMNGAPLPHWNGYPVRLVVPGWTATYWVKQLVSVDVVSKPFQGFWMNPAYRLPKGKFPQVDRFISQETDTNTPITEMVVNSLITDLTEGQQFNRGRPVEVKGIAWDGGYGIQTVEVSVNGGETWRSAELGKDYGKYAWRQWRYTFSPEQKGKYAIMAKASNRIGSTQTFTPIFNPAGYHHNAVQTINILVS